jgi:hypothetical protein
MWLPKNLIVHFKNQMSVHTINIGSITLMFHDFAHVFNSPNSAVEPVDLTRDAEGFLVREDRMFQK